MQVFVVTVVEATPRGFTVSVHGVYQHLTQAMPVVKALRDAGHVARVSRQQVITEGPVAEPDFTASVGPDAGIREMGRAITTPERERAIAQRMIERAQQDADLARRKARGDFSSEKFEVG